jgi:hypothetical protein
LGDTNGQLRELWNQDFLRLSVPFSVQAFHLLIFPTWKAIQPMAPPATPEAHRPFKGPAFRLPDLAPPLRGRAAPAPRAGALGLGRIWFRATFK